MRKLILIGALLAASCSYSEEKADILVTVDHIDPLADHLDVVLTYSDPSVTGRNCTAEASTATNAICYRPSFQPGALSALSPPRIELAIAAASTTGTVKIEVSAKDRNFQQYGGTGSITLNLPNPPNGHITIPP